MTAQLLSEREVQAEVERIRRLGSAGLMDWQQAAELIEQVYDQADAVLDVELNVFQLARLRMVDLIARWQVIDRKYRLSVCQATFAQTATREQLVAAILDSRS
jgi:hypothetical protein